MKATYRCLVAVLLLFGLAPASLASAQEYQGQPQSRSRQPVVYEEDVVYEEEEPAPRPARPPAAKRPPAKKPPRSWEPAQPRPPQARFGAAQRADYVDAAAVPAARYSNGTRRVVRPTATRANYQFDDQPSDGPANPPPEPLYEPAPRRTTPPGAVQKNIMPSRSAAPQRMVAPQPSSAPSAVMDGSGDFYDDGYGVDGGFDDGSGFVGDFDAFPCDSCQPCGPSHGPMYIRGEYLPWWLTGDKLPPLVTTSPTSTPAAQAGVLDQSTTSTLFGGTVNNTGRSGARIAAGWWFSPTTRFEGEVFGLGGQSSGFNQSSTGDPILARPFFNLSTGAPASQLLAYPDEFTGGIKIRETSNFAGAGLHFMQAISYGDSPNGFRHRFDFIYGFRYLGLYDNLTADSHLSAVGASLSSTDGFKTANNFFGGNIGTSMEASRGRWTLLTIGRLGLGGTAERVNISGSSVATSAGQSVTSSGGLLALPTNIGTYSHGGFTVLPQLEMKLAFILTPTIRLSVGYDIMYWSRVVRPGQAVDLYVNPSQGQGHALSGTPGPLFGFQETQLLVQGLSTGIEFRF